MLTNLFQGSDVVLFMDSDYQKRPHTEVLVRLGSTEDTRRPYFAINPIDRTTNRNSGSHRASINVSAFRNFLFESDSLPLDEQLPLLQYLHSKLPLAQVTFSGGSSYHAIISVLDTLPFKPHTDDGIAQYSQAWKALNAELTSIAREYLGDPAVHLFDQACKDPARLSRTPGAVRPDTGNVQSPVSGFGGYVSSDDVLQLMTKHSVESVYRARSHVTPTDPKERGKLTKRTLNFINNWTPAAAHIWAWHPDFIFAVKDLQCANYTFEEAKALLATITGHLDANDLYQMKDVWSRNNFKLDYKPVTRSSNE